MTPTRRTGILLALATALISGFSVFLNSYGVKAFGNPTAYTTAKNIVSALVLLAVVGDRPPRPAPAPRLTRPRGPRQWGALAAIGVVGGSVPFVLFFEGLSQGDLAAGGLPAQDAGALGRRPRRRVPRRAAAVGPLARHRRS